MIKVHFQLGNWFVLVAVIVLNQCSIGIAYDFVTTSDNSSSESYVRTDNFLINYDCISQHPIVFEQKANSSEACKSFLELNSSDYDVLIWNSSNACLWLSYKSLKKCPVAAVHGKSKFVIFFKISKNIPSLVKNQLITHGYRNHLKRLLSCDTDSFLCNDFECISGKFRCDGITQCLDSSDERLCRGDKKCYGRNGRYYFFGEEFIPNIKLNRCTACICGPDGQPSHCFSPLCRMQLNCHRQSSSICCQCFGNLYPNSSLDSQSRRLLLSTISIIFFVTLLLVFSRCFLKESIRRRSFGNVSRPSWLAMFAENERNGNTLRSRSAMNPQGPVHDGRMYYRNSLVIFDVPPPYKPRDSVGEGEMELPLAYGTDAVGSEQVNQARDTDVGGQAPTTHASSTALLRDEQNRDNETNDR